MIQKDDQVRSRQFGIGRVILADGQTAVVRFEHGIEECLAGDLEEISTPLQAIQRPVWDAPLEVVTRVQAEAIQSINDTWGVLSKSRIALLPHQLWVCRQVLDGWPARWMVADDVGLGKTIEAGLILWPLLSRKRVHRLLILCPASLVEQWQVRLREMFDIRLAQYVPEADTPQSDFWHTHPQVVASLQTLRKDSRERHERMVAAPPWDLVLVDEAHHLNADEQSGPTLGYKFVEKLVKANQITSMVFFTGTPHRGKDYGFLSLLKLLRPDLFDPRRPMPEQLPRLKRVLIRNNKQNVTDLKGKRLFSVPKVTSETYSYSQAEDRFYSMLTEFIASGKAYASTLNASDQRTAILVLIAMQKLASSSVAAIRRALRNRLDRVKHTREELADLEHRKSLLQSYEESEAANDTDCLGEIEEQIVDTTAALSLMLDEEPRLKELLNAADAVAQETKIDKILSLLDERFAGRSVLFFTEYKATQSVLMSALMRKYGQDCVTFINGDGRAEGILLPSGQVKTLTETRTEAASRFNDGRVRFLVSTEAAGEGIDLQENCHTLIHVDLPWNPMRLHQRVGRINRYGQTERVEVMTLRNPSTVESRIWDKLNTKIDSIMRSLGEVMDEPEDLLELVLGMASPQMFREVFSQADGVPKESLGKWFDEKTSTFGGRDALDTVKALVGHARHFDFQQVSDKIPKIDLPALKPFFLAMLARNQRNVQETGNGLSFKTPEDWMRMPAIRSRYQDVRFERSVDRSVNSTQILGVGHALVDEAISQARNSEASLTVLPPGLLARPLFVFRIVDKVTSQQTNVRAIIAGVEVGEADCDVCVDWHLLERLNQILGARTLRRDGPPPQPSNIPHVEECTERAQQVVVDSLGQLDHSFDVPEANLIAILWPMEEAHNPPRDLENRVL